MNNITFNELIVNWSNNLGNIIAWDNSSSSIVEWVTSAPAGNSIRYADFVRITTGGTTYLFTTAPANMTVPAVDSSAFSAVGLLMKIGDAQRDIKSTANETSITLSGIDTSMLGYVLGQTVKGSKVEMWHGFFNTDGELITSGGTGGLYKFFTGYVNSFAISEQWMEEIRSYIGTVSISASSVQLILQNRTAGRYTNDDSWQFFNSGDTSMNRVSFISTINYQFGKQE